MFREKADHFRNFTPQERLDRFLSIAKASHIPKEFMDASSKVSQQIKTKGDMLDFHEIAKRLVGRRFDTFNLSAYAWSYPQTIARCKLWDEVAMVNAGLNDLIGSTEFQESGQFEEKVHRSALEEVTTLFQQESGWMYQPQSPTIKQLGGVIDYVERYFAQP